MEGLELFAGNTSVEKQLVAKLKEAQELLNEYKEELALAETRVSAHAHILRLLAGESIPGMCGGCYIKLKKRVRSLEAEHLSSDALARGVEGPKEQNELETVALQKQVKPVRAARRIPRPVELEPVADSLAALTRINVVRHQREPSSADSVAAVIYDPRLAVSSGAVAEGGSSRANSPGVQDEVKSSKKVTTEARADPKLSPEGPEKLVRSAQEHSGEWSVNGTLKEGQSEPSKAGHSPLDKTDYKSVDANDSSEEGSTARAGGEGVDSMVGKPLSRVLNHSSKSMDSSASSIVGPAGGPEKEDSSEGQAESEWKDAPDDLSDDGDSKAPALGTFPMQKGAENSSIGEVGKAKMEKHETAKSEGSVEHTPKAVLPVAEVGEGRKAFGEAEVRTNSVFEVETDGKVQSPNDKQQESDGDSETLDSNGVAEVEGPAVDKEVLISVDHVESPASSEVEETVVHVVDSTEENRPRPLMVHTEGELAGEHISAEEHATAGSTSSELRAHLDGIESETGGAGSNVAHDVIVEAQLHDRELEALLAGSSIVPQREETRPSRAPAGSKQRPKIAMNYGFAMALKAAERTREEGLSREREKQQRIDAVLKQNEERERVEREKERESRARQAASRGAEGQSAGRTQVEKDKENRNPVKPAGREKRSASETDEDNSGEQCAPPNRTEGPERNYSQALVSKPAAQEREPVQGGAPRRLSGRERMVSERSFIHNERDKSGRLVNILQGLELHKSFLSEREQQKLVERIYDLQKKGQAGELMSRTYTQPRKWMRGKGRVTIQFGCCYNYAIDRLGNPPGIMRDEEVDPLPPDIVGIIDRLVDWGVMPVECRPDSCIINIYNEGDCIPPHIDHHDFLRPFCTLSLLSEAEILFGTRLQAVDEGVFDGPVRISLPVGSVLILSGNGADLAKHCIPGVPAKRISITLRKMDPAKAPYHLTQTALHTPLPGPPPQNERGVASDRWRKEEHRGRPRFPSPKPEAKEVETWPELRVVEKKDEKQRVPSEGGDLQGVWGKRQQEASTQRERMQSRGEESPARDALERPPSKRMQEEVDHQEKAARIKPLSSTLRAQAAPFEAPPKRLASPNLEALNRTEGRAARGASFDSPPPARGASRVTSTSLTSSPAKTWASSTEAPVAATSDLAMAVRKMVEGEGGKMDVQTQNQGAGLSAAAPEFAPPKREAGVRPRSGGMETKAAATADKFVDGASTSWADIEVDTVSPRQTVWPSGCDKQIEQSREALTFKENEANELERRLRALDNESDRRGGPRGGGPRLRERQTEFSSERSAERLNRLGFGGMLRDRGERWGHDDRAQEPSRSEDRRSFSRAQDDFYPGSSRIRGIGRPEEGASFRDTDGKRGEKLVTHSRAEALKEAGGW